MIGDVRPVLRKCLKIQNDASLCLLLKLMEKIDSFRGIYENKELSNDLLKDVKYFRKST